MHRVFMWLILAVFIIVLVRRTDEVYIRRGVRSSGRLSTDDGQLSSGNVAETRVERYVDEQVNALEERFRTILEEESRRLNQSVAIQYIEKVLEYINEEMQINRDLLTTRRDDRQREIDGLRNEVERQRDELGHWQQTVRDLQAIITNLTSLLDSHLSSSNADITNQKEPTSTPPAKSPIDCQDAYNRGVLLRVSGFQFPLIQPFASREPFKVCCYVDTDNTTSWTVIQRRLDGSIDFYRNWNEYRRGFGQLEGEFWLGNEHIHEITSQGDYRLRIEMVTWDDKPHWAEYQHFRLAPESEKFRLYVAGFVPGGTAGDSLTSAWDNDHNGQPFSTYDRDNDARFYDNCAQHYRGAWWFRSCFQSHLNGVYYQRGAHSNFFIRNGIQWNTIHPHSSLRHVTMMVRRTTDLTTDDELFSNGVE